MLHRGPLAFGLTTLLSCLGCSDDDDESQGDRGDGNVDFRTSCSLPTVCGGDPTGMWDVVETCAQASGPDFDCDWEQTAWGSVSGTVQFDSGSYSIETFAELRHCGGPTRSGRISGGIWTLMGTTIVLGDNSRTLSFCVEGDTLWLWDMAATFPDFSVFELQRSDGG